MWIQTLFFTYAMENRKCTRINQRNEIQSSNSKIFPGTERNCFPVLVTKSRKGHRPAKWDSPEAKDLIRTGKYCWVFLNWNSLIWFVSSVGRVGKCANHTSEAHSPESRDFPGTEREIQVKLFSVGGARESGLNYCRLQAAEQIEMLLLSIENNEREIQSLFLFLVGKTFLETVSKSGAMSDEN